MVCHGVPCGHAHVLLPDAETLPKVTWLNKISLLRPKGVTLTQPCFTAQLSLPAAMSLHTKVKIMLNQYK